MRDGGGGVRLPITRVLSAGGGTARRRRGGGAASASSSARTIAPALSQRSSGSLAMPRASTRSAAAGTSMSRSDAIGGSSSTWARAWAAKFSAWNGLPPVSSSNATTASA